MSILKKGKKYQIMFSFNKFHQLLRQNIGEICCHSLRGSVDWNCTLQGAINVFNVTPYAGVWIEILNSPTFHIFLPSLPTRECGLKSVLNLTDVTNAGHSLRGSVDWNSKIVGNPTDTSKSLPTRECGLKSNSLLFTSFSEPSLPTRECGLKLPHRVQDAILTGHSLRGSVDWNTAQPSIFTIVLCHSLRGSVDWNSKNKHNCWNTRRHSLRGSVDWNQNHLSNGFPVPRHSLRGSVDWNWW